ncbi:uncharacterized protein LOC143296218 [Babylonia areolata]|uniref:uncharacterized protein LOC143296218 n=1 Tax=Babylonia areolata TaxID=304850 RepID=UPI003FD0B40E
MICSGEDKTDVTSPEVTSMTDPLQPDRLLRKRNSNLQKQLDVTLQILSEEYRQCKERMYKEERDCGKFLQTLYETVPGLQSYGQPNTRSMSASGVLRDRQFSLSPPPAEPPHPDSPRLTTTTGQWKGGNPDPGHHDSIPFAQRPLTAWSVVSSRQQQQTGGRWSQNHRKMSGTKAAEKRTPRNSLGSGPFRRDSQGPGMGRGGGGGKVANNKRPQTAGAVHRSQSHVSQEQNPRRPKMSFGFRKTGPCFGKSACSDHERLMHDMVLKKFLSIFDPGVKRDTTSKSTTTPTPAAVLETRGQRSKRTPPQDQSLSGSSDDVNDDGCSESADSGDQKAGEVSEEDSSVGHKPHCGRRVVWSARPHRKMGSVSAPDIRFLDRPASDPASAAAGPAPPKPRSHSLSLPAGVGHTTGTHRTFHGQGLQERVPHLDPKIRALALQKSLPVVGNAETNHHHHPAPPPAAEADEVYGEHGTIRASHTQPRTADQDAQEDGRFGQNTRRRPSVLNNKSQSDTDILKKPPALGKHSHHHHHHHQQQGTDLSAPQHRDGLHQTTAPRRHSTVTPATHRRLSEVSGLVAPEQLVERLMKAGRTTISCADPPRRPKTAPGKSELSHRLVPVSRKTIVGILSEIDNQRASTRTMLSASKDLQQFVKNLTDPLDLLLLEGDSD